MRIANLYEPFSEVLADHRAGVEVFRAQVVTYADDFVILSCGCAAEALDWTRSVMTQIGLTLNEAKTSVKQARRERFDFLGYSFGPHRMRTNGREYLGASPSKKSVSKLRQKVGDLLVPWHVSPWTEVRDRLNRMLRGWSNYFGYGTRLMAYRAVDQYVYQGVRAFLRRRHKVASRGTIPYSDAVVFGTLGVLRLRDVHLGPPSRIELAVKSVGKPDAGENPHVRFDERGKGNHRLPVGPGPAPFLDSTLAKRFMKTSGRCCGCSAGESIVRCQRTEYALVSSLERDPLLAERIKRLRTVPGVGIITALTWALEIGDVARFRSVKQAISYCGLCGEEKSSADKVLRTPLSKQRNKHIQHVLVEAAKLAPRQNHELALIREREMQKGNRNRATLAVARKMVAYLLAVDRREREFVPAEVRSTVAA